jgi:hypothetical protein
MDAPSFIEVELRNKVGELVATTKVDQIDAAKVLQHTWYHSRGYAKTTIAGVGNVRLNRFILGTTSHSVVVDHLNLDKLDNRRANLREATHNQNNQNKAKTQKPTSSTYTGVAKETKNGKIKWRASIAGVYIGAFVNELHAAYAYDQAAVERFGPQTRVNGIARPANYSPPEKRPASALGKNIVMCGPSFQVRIIRTGSKNISKTFTTLAEAVEFRDRTLAQIKANRKRERQEQTIQRNESGVAIIPVHSGDAEPKYALVDDEDYHKLLEWKWGASNGYVERLDSTLDGRKKIALSRWLLGVTEDDVVVDHINNIPLDNRKANLRRSTFSLNAHNRVKASNTSSIYAGVVLDRGRWLASIAKDNKLFKLGSYEDEATAAWVRNCKAIELYGTFARLNQVDQPSGWVWENSRARKVALDGSTISREGASALKRKMRSDNKTGFIGVAVQGARFKAFAKYNKKDINLGVYDSAKVAAWVRDCKMRELYGDQVTLNGVEQPPGWVFKGDRATFVKLEEEGSEEEGPPAKRLRC